MKKLVESGADIRYRNRDGLAALDYAILPGFKEIAIFLFKRMNKDKE